MARVDMKWGGVYGSGSKEGNENGWLSVVVVVAAGGLGKQRKARAIPELLHITRCWGSPYIYIHVYIFFVALYSTSLYFLSRLYNTYHI